MNKPMVRIRKGSQEKFPSRQASNPEMTQEYTVTSVTAERVAINHLETTSRASHSFLSSILISCHEALRHIPKLMFIILLDLIYSDKLTLMENYTIICEIGYNRLSITGFWYNLFMQ